MSIPQDSPITANEGPATGQSRAQFNAEMESLKEIFGEMYEPYVTNNEYQVLDYMKKYERDNTPPPTVHPWECRIGLSRFVVPPINISVSQVGRAAAIGGALRQQSSPKFNSGHSETMITMTLYFPTHEAIWGFEGNKFEINWETAADSVVDSFASSLRGLIAQFKYAPFLPIKCQYINQTYGITGVAMHSMSVSTVEGFPFCLGVQLNLLNFNHKVYLPMISDFDQAMHWGRFRQYVGRASDKLSEVANKSFLTNFEETDYEALYTQQSRDSLLARFREASSEQYAKRQTSKFDKLTEWKEGKGFDIYYPAHTPVNVVYPDLTNFRDPNAGANGRKQLNWWQTVIEGLGFPYAADEETTYEKRSAFYEGNFGDFYLRDERRLLTEWLRIQGTRPEKMLPELLDTYLDSRLTDVERQNPQLSINARDEFLTKVRDSWFSIVYESFVTDPYLANIFEYQEQLRGTTLIKEWEVPMRRLDIDKNNVIVNGISVSMGNNFARHQIQLQEEPTHQHLGGADTRVDISLTVFGEAEIAKLKRIWTHINGLARLEHGHGVLGFIGIKNVVTALCGMKYAMMESFEIDTKAEFPHVYDVRISLIDFDVFQQKREMLSSDQQAEFIEAFSKRNPFLRIKQRWGAFNAYPDFPLTVRDEDGKIVGNLDPDFYFKSFRTIDDDVADIDNGFDSPVEQIILQENAKANVIQVTKDGLRFPDGDGVYGDVQDWWEANADQVKIQSQIPGLTPPSNYQNPYKDSGGNPVSAFRHVLQDAQFRDDAGRMIKAFPTYMLWLVDEGGTFSGVKLYDNFYGLQSVIDIAVGLSEDAMADTAIIQLSNLYSRLSTPYRNLVDESLYDQAHIINTQLNRQRNLMSGLTDELVLLDTFELKPGVRIHLRMGYSANPNAMDTVFNGVITNVEQGEIITVSAQSDAVELSAIVNNTNTEGHTGKSDGSLFGMWVSEPRDLMIRLLTMGASAAKEATAHASRGRIFSESRWGIRHFGSMIYPPMTERERALSLHRGTAIDGAVKRIMGGDIQSSIGGPAGLFNFGLFDVFSSMSSNFFRKRDYEVFKRNIYPGNGTGISQYMGGDFGDGGLALGLMSSTGVGVDGTIIDPRTGQPSVPRTAEDIVGTAPENRPGQSTQTQRGERLAGFNEVMGIHDQPHAFLAAMGLSQQDGDDDVRGADEVSFRASTYMKSVWDLFQTCAALLPNYIVAIRPFEERSTIFYGKPHWLYTSGVIPLTTGVNHDQLGIEDPDTEILELLEEARRKAREEDVSDQEFYDRLGEVSADPTETAPAGGGDGGGGSEDIDHFMAAIRRVESGSFEGNYKAESPQSTASGAYQYLTGTWGRYKGFATAGQAPKAIQDEKARADMLGFYATYKTWKLVAYAWHGGPGIANKVRDGKAGAGANQDAAGNSHDKYWRDVERYFAERKGTSGAVAPVPAIKAVAASFDFDVLVQMKEKGISDPAQFSYLYGWGMDKFPVNYTDLERGLIDDIGRGAREVYHGQVDDGKAQDVWNEFRIDFRKEGKTKDAFRRFYPGQTDVIYNKVVDEFQKYMWQHAYHRGWLVRTVDVTFSVGGLITGDLQSVGDFLGRAPGIFGTPGDAISEIADDVGGVINGAVDIVTNPISTVGNLLGGGSDSDNDHDFHNARKVFELWLVSPDEAKEYMINHTEPGSDQRGIFGRTVEEFYTNVWENVWDVFSGITKAIGSAVTGVLSMMRFSLLGLNQGITQATFNQAISNMMNQAFNDSIYFQAGPPGTLAYLADNPFTREYGEPVVEIRQPFQRVHIVNSFRNILSNNIQENTEGIATVITGTSGGKHPQTVHLDKALPAEKQVERAVETGLVWDKPGGIPIIRNILNPGDTLRSFADNFNNGDDETSAKRVALWHLKEGLKDIYGGEIMILGDANIRPFDLLYVGDVYSRMFGLVEVEQVVHHFNAEMGFVTSITPNAIVTVHDPARWSMLSHMRARMNTWNLRNDMRQVYLRHQGVPSGLGEFLNMNDLATAFGGQVMGSIEYTGGNTAITKDLGGMSYTNQLGAGQLGPASETRPEAIVGGFRDWSPWNYVKDNLLDQQSCYIQFLTQNGQPMDANLYDNKGIAVGSQRTSTLFKNSLRIPLNFNNQQGNSNIATNDLLAALGWTEMQVGDLIQDLDLETNLIKGQILEIAGRVDDGSDSTDIAFHIVTVTKVTDADTFDFSPAINGNNTLRLVGIDTPEVAHKDFGDDNESDLEAAEQLNPDDPGVIAWRYAFDRLAGRRVAIRIANKEPVDQFGRYLGYVFINGDNDKTLLAQAGGEPILPWDSYLPDGTPYTLNWELVIAGHANVFLFEHDKNLPNQGADGAFIGDG